MFKKTRSTTTITSNVHTEDTKLDNINHKNHDFTCILAISHHNQKVAKMEIFQNLFFRKKKYRKNPL